MRTHCNLFVYLLFQDVWKFAKLAVRKFIKYDLPLGTQIGLLTFSSDIKVVANMTTLDDNLRAILAEKLPSYPKIEHGGGTLSFRKGILHCINVSTTREITFIKGNVDELGQST